MLELLLAAALAAPAPPREAKLSIFVQADPTNSLVYHGRVRTRLHDKVATYLTKGACESSMPEARRENEIIMMFNPDAPDRRWWFRGEQGFDSVRPKQGRVCLMIATQGGAKRVQVSRRYKLPT